MQFVSSPREILHGCNSPLVGAHVYFKANGEKVRHLAGRDSDRGPGRLITAILMESCPHWFYHIQLSYVEEINL